MATKNQQKSAASGAKTEQHVGLENEPLIKNNPYDLSWVAIGFILDMGNRVNDETYRYLHQAFSGFKEEVQEDMVRTLRSYFEEVGPEGEQHLNSLHVEHIDMLLNQIVYKIEHGYNRLK